MYKRMLMYFLNKYKELHETEYVYSKSKLGLVYMQLKRLRMEEKEFKSFVNWLHQRKKLSSINFLMTQVNDFHSSEEYQKIKRLNELILHQDIMIIRFDIVDKCPLCKNGYTDKFEQCKCMKKFLKIRDKMRRESKW